MKLVLLVSVALMSSTATGHAIAQTQTGQAAPAPAASAARPHLELLEAGDAPRQTLRVNAAKGERVGMVFTLKSHMSQRMGEMVLRGNLPTQELRVTMAAAAQPQRVDLELTSAKLLDTPDVMTGMLEVSSAELPAIAGFKSSWSIDAQGSTVGSEFIPPKEPNLRQKKSLETFNELVQDMFVPFPKEAVGKGAKWSVESEVPEYRLSATARSKRKATYEIVGIEGGKVKLAITYTQSAENPPLDTSMGGESSGIAMVCKKFDVSGSGTLVIDLKRGAWADVSMSRTSRQDLTATVGGQTIASESTLDLMYEFVPGPREGS